MEKEKHDFVTLSLHLKKLFAIKCVFMYTCIYKECNFYMLERNNLINKL